MARVKICGITRLEDALESVRSGADALGFIFHPPSPRYVRPEIVRDICAALPPFVTRVGVFVDSPSERIQEVVRVTGVDAVQFHGRETPDQCRQVVVGRRIKGFRVADATILNQLPEYTGMSWLLDSYVAGVFGGTGQTFNWDLACEAVRRGGHVILAGGLTPENVGRAVAAVDPYGVDVSSGVESAPGIKDPERVREFIAAAKSA